MHQISELLFKKFARELPTSNIVLVPIMRAGLGMWAAANEHFDVPHTEFVLSKKTKGSTAVQINWPNRATVLADHVLILDPIIATGDTIVAVWKTMPRNSGGRPKKPIIVACYGAPSGLKKILDEVIDSIVVVARVAKRVLPNGMLSPPTRGDMGDKLYRSTS